MLGVTPLTFGEASVNRGHGTNSSLPCQSVLLVHQCCGAQQPGRAKGTLTSDFGKLLPLRRANFYPSAGQPKIRVFCETVTKKLTIRSSITAPCFGHLVGPCGHFELHDAMPSETSWKAWIQILCGRLVHQATSNHPQDFIK